VGLFRSKAAPAFGVSEVKASAGAAGRPGTFSSYYVGSSTERALSLPTVSRAVGLITSTIASLDLRTYTLRWDGERYDKQFVMGESWMSRPDPNTTRQFVMSNTVKDLMLIGRAFWYVTSRYATGFPASFMWLPAHQVDTPNQPGPEWFGEATEVNFNGVELDVNNVVQFLSPLDGMMWTGARAIDIAYRLDESAKRFASNEIAAGYLQQTEGEPLAGEELSELAAAWSQARKTSSVGALNQHVEWREFKSNPNNLQLMEAREYASLELARTLQVPPWLVGVAVGSMTYQNAQQARQDLLTFGASPFLTCISETLSSDKIVSKGKHVEFNTDAYLETADIVTETPTGEPDE
jgi:HK97 family phage portal protein